MFRKVVSSLVLCAAVGVLTAGTVLGQEKAEKVANPLYTGWSSFKPGTTLTIQEKTTFGSAEKGFAPAAGDIKIVRYKLVSVDKNKAVVLTTVVENEFLSTVESAPTRITYPATVARSDFEAALHKIGANLADGKVTVLGKEMECKVVSGTEKLGTDEVSRKLSYCKSVPGGIAERVTTTKHDGKLVAETVATVTEFKVKE